MNVRQEYRRRRGTLFCLSHSLRVGVLGSTYRVRDTTPCHIPVLHQCLKEQPVVEGGLTPVMKEKMRETGSGQFLLYQNKNWPFLRIMLFRCFPYSRCLPYEPSFFLCLRVLYNFSSFSSVLYDLLWSFVVFG